MFNVSLSTSNEAQESGNLIAVEFYTSKSGWMAIWVINYSIE